ncbi:hypothetical protein [Synechococcus sp. WH 8109]|uniref:hypothetical protein n=1 Tax=Synechococcus sp. WH 8109 TaxID=166314 RepID=UPI001E47EB9C|nr:hypothetical protein [Synechococcus sp. WH 8109]
MAEYKAQCEWLRPYSLRDTFGVRAHGIVKDDTLITAAMGHTVEVHHCSYRTTKWRSLRTAFARAGGNEMASLVKHHSRCNNSSSYCSSSVNCDKQLKIAIKNCLPKHTQAVHCSR